MGILTEIMKEQLELDRKRFEIRRNNLEFTPSPPPTERKRYKEINESNVIKICAKPKT